MNKLEGFFELNNLGIPSVPWKEYSPEVYFDEKYLWTIRVAIDTGVDFDLPRAVGVKYDVAKKKAEEFFHKYNQNGMVIYYPYFIADKSGIVEIRKEELIIEAVDKDLWNLATDGRRDETIIINGSINRHGKQGFVSDQELEDIVNSVKKVKSKFRDFLVEGKSVLLEWSYAKNMNDEGMAVGDSYLVFYECKAV